MGGLVPAFRICQHPRAWRGCRRNSRQPRMRHPDRFQFRREDDIMNKKNELGKDHGRLCDAVRPASVGRRATRMTEQSSSKTDERASTTGAHRRHLSILLRWLRSTAP